VQSDHELKKLIEKKFSASQASKVDLLNAEVVTQQLAQAVLENRNDYEVLLTQFRQIIRRPSDTTLLPKIADQIIVPPVKKSFDELVPVMLRNNHVVGAATKQVDSQSALVTNSALQALPDLQLSAGINTWLPSGAPLGSDVTRDYTVGIGVVIPIFYPFNELQGLKAAQHNLGAAENQLTSQQLQAIASLQTAYVSLGAMLKDLETSEKLVVPAAKESYDLSPVRLGTMPRAIF
jgi:outer membrane protein